MVSRKIDPTMITDITLDHLPDLSEDTLSFEIPNDNSSADCLLADATGFNALYNTMDDETSFAPVAHVAAAHMNHRGPMLTLAHLTPKAGTRKRVPSRSPSPSAMSGPSMSISQPSEVPQPPTLRRSPRKRRETPSRALSQSRHLPLEGYLPSEEPLDQLHADTQTLGRVHEQPLSHVDTDFVAHDKDLPVRGRKTPSRSRSKQKSQPVSETHVDHLPEVNTLDRESMSQPREDMEVVVHHTDVSRKRRRTPSRSSSRRSVRLVSEEHLDQIQEVQTLHEDLQPKSREDELDVTAQDANPAVKRRRVSSRSPTKRRSQLVSEEHLDQIPEVETQELDVQPCEGVDVITNDKAETRKRSKTPSRSRSKRGVRLVSEEHLFSIPEVQTLDQQLETQVHGDSCGTAHDQHIPDKIIETPLCANSGHLEGPPVSEEPLLDQVTAEEAFDQALGAENDRDVVIVTQDMQEVDTRDTVVPAVPAVSAVSRAEVKRNPRTKVKPTVAAGGISNASALPGTHVSKKTKSKPSSVREARPLPFATAGRASPPQSLPPIDALEKLVPPAIIDGDIDMTSQNTKLAHPSTSGMAERLVSYSQKLISSIGLYKPFTEPSFTERDAVRAEAQGRTPPPAIISLATTSPSAIPHDISSAQEAPLSVSEIPPQRLPSDGQPSSAEHVGRRPLHDDDDDDDGRQPAMSPMRRPAKKRRSMDVGLASQDQDPEQPRCKKGKTVLATSPERRSSEEASSQDQDQDQRCRDLLIKHADHRVANGVDNKRRRDAVLKTDLPSARTKYRPKVDVSPPQCKGPMLRALPYMASSRQVYGTISKDKGKCDDEREPDEASTIRRRDTRMGRSLASFRARRPGGETAAQGKTINSFRTRPRSGPKPTINSALVEKKPNATVVSVAALTKPVAFTFRVDARLEARKVEEKEVAGSEPGKTSQEHAAVPDFKALHESHQALLAFRKENVVPSVPVVPFFFRTEQRAKEREKFDEAVRRKEEEMQRLKEEQLKLEAEEEDRAIRELRRKAIPKASEMPEWYADMPKRKGTAVPN